MTIIGTGTGLLHGAAGTYLGTNKGIFPVTGGTTLGTLLSVGSVRGIVAGGSDVYAVTTERRVRYGSTFSSSTSAFTPEFSGAMALWPNSTPQLILLGLQRGSGSYGYGYRELKGNSLLEPGAEPPTSVEPSSQYTSAIGKHGVTAIYVLPGSDAGDGRPIIFASTVKDGLWSYRSRDGKPHWNGEDNSN
jgi:hypothetical protein